jgi:hypothetical protein
MKKVIAVLLVLAVMGSFAYAADEMAATGDAVATIVESPFVVTGKVLNVVTGQDNVGTVTVSNDSGETKVFPIDQTVQIVDASMTVATLGVIKSGDTVTVEGTKAGDKETVKAVTVAK